jgi:hypothetical protein
MSEGYRRPRELRLVPPGQHRQGTGAGGWPAAAEWATAGGTRYNGTQGSWDCAGFDSQFLPARSSSRKAIELRVDSGMASMCLDRARGGEPGVAPGGEQFRQLLGRRSHGQQGLGW